MRSEVKSLIVDIVTILIAVVCVVGNLVLFWKLFFRKHPKIIVYLIILGTAAVDVVKMILTISFIILRRTDFVHFDWGKYCSYIYDVCTYIAAWNIVLFCVVRFIILENHPCMIRTRRYIPHALIGCVFLWLLILVSNIPLIVSHSSDYIRDTWLFFSFSYIIPCFVIVSLYMLSRIYRRIPIEDYSSGKRRFSHMVTMLVMMFVVYKLPHIVGGVVMMYTSYEVPYSYSLYYVYNYIWLVSLLDAACRPIVIIIFFCRYQSTEYDASSREPLIGIELPEPNPLPPTTAGQTSNREPFTGMDIPVANTLTQAKAEFQTSDRELLIEMELPAPNSLTPTTSEGQTSYREPFMGMELPVSNPLTQTTSKGQTSDGEPFIGMELPVSNSLTPTTSEGQTSIENLSWEWNYQHRIR